MEAALAIATLVLVLVLCLAGVTAVSMQVRALYRRGPRGRSIGRAR